MKFIYIDSNVFELQRVFFLRMKCVLAKRNAGLTTGGYKVKFKHNINIYKHINSIPIYRVINQLC